MNKSALYNSKTLFKHKTVCVVITTKTSFRKQLTSMWGDLMGSVLDSGSVQVDVLARDIMLCS